ncbi:MAG: CAP domain-containing protein [Xenococcaceae cyanobacterium]
MSTNSQFINKVVQLVNLERAKLRLDPLQIDAQLSNAAQQHSQNMANKDFFSHTGKDGSSPFTRIKQTGYLFSTAAENIAVGYGTPEAVVKGWMGSSGHRSNILNANFTEIGVGYEYLANDTGMVNYHNYWTTTFGDPL